MSKLLVIVGSTRPTRASDHVTPWLVAKASAHDAFETEVAGDVARRHAVALLDLIKHAGLGQRKCAVEPTRPQHAEVLSIKAIEATHRGNASRILDAGDRHADSIGQLLAKVKYLVRIRRHARDGTYKVTLLFWLN